MPRNHTIFDDPGFQHSPQKPRQSFLGQFKRLAIIVAALPVVTSGVIFCWSILGEMLLPEPYRHSTFSGDKEGRRKTHEIHMSMTAEAERQELMTASQSLIQLRQQCQQSRNSAANQVYQQCLQQPGVTTACDWQRNQILVLPCDQFLPEDLSEKLKNLMKNGENYD